MLRRREGRRWLFGYGGRGPRRGVRIRAVDVLENGIGIASMDCSWDEREGRTRYQPVGLPVLPILLWEVRTKRTLGAILNVLFRLINLLFN